MGPHQGGRCGTVALSFQGQSTGGRQARLEADRAKAAWNQKPKRYKTRFERTLYSGPTPRKDAEEEERTRWVHELALLVSGSDRNSQATSVSLVLGSVRRPFAPKYES